jgi:hypothetical protein
LEKLLFLSLHSNNDNKPKYFQQEVLNEEFDAVTSNAPLAFPHFDVVSHYMSQPRTPELEKSGGKHLPGCAILHFITIHEIGSAGSYES